MIQDFISAFKQEYKLKGKSLLLHPFENQNIERITKAVKENNIIYPVTVMLDSRIREHNFLDLNHSYYRPFLDTLSNHDKIDESFENLFVLFYDKPNAKRKKILDHYLDLIGDEGFAFILTAGTEVLMRHYYDHLLQKFSIEMIVATAFAENRSAIDKTLFILKKKGEEKKAVDPTYLFKATKDLPSKASIKRNIRAFKNSEFMHFDDEPTKFYANEIGVVGEGNDGNIGRNFNFKHLEIDREIQHLSLSFPNSHVCKLGEIIDDFFSASERNESRLRALRNKEVILIPRTFHPRVISDIKEIDVSHRKRAIKLMHIFILKNGMNAKYIAKFLNTPLGKNIRKLHSIGTTIQSLSSRKCLELEIFIPSKNNIDIMLSTDELVQASLKSIRRIQGELVTNPANASVQSKLRKLLQALDELTPEEEILIDIKKGEAIDREFKESYRLDKKTKEVNKELEFSCFRSIAAFLNTQGGTLYVGVSDDMELIGLNDEIKKLHKRSNDKFLLFFQNKLKGEIGSALLSNIEFSIFVIQQRKILVVNVKKPSSKKFTGAYLKSKKNGLYTRSGPSNDFLEGSDLVKYTTENF
ncbi:putative DNA binding domain-containing protein [Gammaproteobacteria bacterium]|nr:putative DNA binding domain-containing protein [Gammaproteobacteria bacterium]